MIPSQLPLDDVRVLAVEQYGAGPWGTAQLVELGAEVIKHTVEVLASCGIGAAELADLAEQGAFGGPDRQPHTAGERR